MSMTEERIDHDVARKIAEEWLAIEEPRDTADIFPLARAYLSLLIESTEQRQEYENLLSVLRLANKNAERRGRELAEQRKREGFLQANLDGCSAELKKAVDLCGVLQEREERLREFAEFVQTLGDPRAIELRRSITLTEIINRAREALASPTKDEGGKPEGWPDKCGNCGASWTEIGFEVVDGFNCRSCGASDADE